MALTNPKYARTPILGGFNSAAPVSTATQMTVPRDVAAEKAGSALADSTYTEDPKGAVKAAFSASSSESGGGSNEPIPPLPKEEALPAPLSSNDVASAFAPLLNEISNQKAPPGRPVPPPTPALATFLSVLAGTLGAQMAKDPRVEENIISTLDQHEQQRQAIQDQNYANELMFNREKANRRLSAMGQMLETEVDAAMKANDAERAMKANKNLEILRGFVEGRNIMLQGREQQKTASIAANAKMEAAPGATLEPKDYASRRGEILTSKNLPENAGHLWWTTHPRAGELAQLDKEALHSGNDATQAAAKRNIQQAVLRTLGLQMKTKFTRDESVKIKNTLRTTYDLDPSEVDF